MLKWPSGTSSVFFIFASSHKGVDKVTLTLEHNFMYNQPTPFLNLYDESFFDWKSTFKQMAE